MSGTVLGWDYLEAKVPGFSAQEDFPDDLPKEWTGESNGNAEAKTAELKPLKAVPYKWADPRTIPLRAWLYAYHFIRGFLSATFAPGGIGKSSLLIVEALAMATGKNLLGALPATKLRVWYWNGEDPRDELNRRIAAVCLHYNIAASDIGDRLFVSSGRDMELVIAYDDRGGTKVAKPVVEALRAEILANQIDVLIIDPFVASHAVSENDNGSINAVSRQFAMIAEQTGCAIELVHHVRKGAPGQGEYSVDDARGASALLAAVRSARTLNLMSKDEASRAGVENPRSYFRVDNGKANLAPPADKSTWRRHVSVQLGNGKPIPHAGDSMGVVTAWEWPDPTDDVAPEDIRAVQDKVAAGQWREHPKAQDWVGNPIADVLRLDLNEPAARATVKALIRTWLQDGVLKLVKGRDAKRVERNFVEVGKRVKQ